MSKLLFIIQKGVSFFFHPLGAAVGLWLLGVLFWARRPGGKFGPTLLLLGGLVLLVFSVPQVGWRLLHPLEEEAGDYANPQQLQKQGVTHIVVLAGGDARPGDATGADASGGITTLRVLEGVRLWRQVPDAVLVLSGGSYRGDNPPAPQMVALARELGVPPQSMMQEKASWNTEDQARLLHRILAGKPFALVTSAAHIPRAMRIFQYYGLNPVPAPADFRTLGPLTGWRGFVPSTSGLKNSTNAVHEYVGLVWFRLRRLVRGDPAPAPDQANGGD